MGLYPPPPPGFEHSSTKQIRCAIPIRDAFFALLLCSADLFCSLSLWVSHIDSCGYSCEQYKQEG